MKKLFLNILRLIKRIFTPSSTAERIDPRLIASLKKQSPEDLLEKLDDLIRPVYPEIAGSDQIWENTLGSIIVHPELTFCPGSLDELRAIILQAEATNHKIRAVGSGHSFSDVAPTNEYLVFTHGLNRTSFPDSSVLTDTAKQTKLFETEAGITLHELNEVLDSKNLALSTMGAFDAQTIIGAISTGTHGTGLEPGSMAGMVRSIVLVTSGGKVMRIEPATGITDRAEFHHPFIQLVQDDNMFYAVLVSMGCMGIIYSLIIEVMGGYWLDEVKTLTDWDAARQVLSDGVAVRNNRHFEVQVNPYLTKGQRTCLISRQNIKPNLPGEVPAAHGHRNYLSALLDLIPDAPEAVRLYLNTFPEKIPGAIDSALKSLMDSSDYFDKSYKVLYEGLPNFKHIGYASEFAFSLKNNRYLIAVEKIFEVAADLRQQSKKYIDSPLSLRFVKASNAPLSMDFGEDTCFIDITLLYGSRYGDQVLDFLQDEMIALGGRPHWGKINNMQCNIIKDFYPGFSNWSDIRRQLDPNNIFSNDFTNRFGLCI